MTDEATPMTPTEQVENRGAPAPTPRLEEFIELAKQNTEAFFDRAAGGLTMPVGLMQCDDGSVTVLALDIPVAEIGAAFISASMKEGKHPLFGAYAAEAWWIPEELRNPGDEKLRWADDDRALEVLVLYIRAFELKRWFQAVVTTEGATRTLGEWRELERGADVLRFGPFSIKVVKRDPTSGGAP